MTFTVAVGGTCAGNRHIHLDISVGGQTRRITMTREDMQADFSSYDEAVDAVKRRIVSVVKETSASSLAQLRAALEGKDWKV